MARQLITRVSDEVVGEFSKAAQESWRVMLDKYLIEHATTSPMVTMIANDNWVEFTLRFAVDFKKRRITKDILFSRLLDEIDQTGGKVAMTSATFHLVETPVFDVRLMDK